MNCNIIRRTAELYFDSTVKVVKQYFRQRINILPQKTKNISLHICEQCVSSTNKHFATTGAKILGSTGKCFGSRNEQRTMEAASITPIIVAGTHFRAGRACSQASQTYAWICSRVEPGQIYTGKITNFTYNVNRI